MLSVGGALFTLIGSAGVAKLGDFCKRLHGPTQVTTLGVGCVLLASMLWFSLTGTRGLHALRITAVLFASRTPVLVHLPIRAAMQLDVSLKLLPPPQ
jgi:multicomponent K+:H+ antiporter subunit G